jgi:broad specificity phosphatase PhoE
VFKQDFEVLKSLYPRKCGNLSGKSFDKVIKPNSENPPFDCLNINEGESLEDFNKRVETVIKSLVAENIGNRLLIVTYPYVIQSVIAYILGLSPENQAKILIKTGSLTQISCFDTWSSLIYSGYVPLY